MDYRDNRQRWAESHQVVHFYAGQWCTFTPALTCTVICQHCAIVIIITVAPEHLHYDRRDWRMGKTSSLRCGHCDAPRPYASRRPCYATPLESEWATSRGPTAPRDRQPQVERTRRPSGFPRASCVPESQFNEEWRIRVIAAGRVVLRTNLSVSGQRSARRVSASRPHVVGRGLGSNRWRVGGAFGTLGRRRCVGAEEASARGNRSAKPWNRPAGE